MAVTIVVPDERAAQLKWFATSLDISTAEAIGILINDAIAAGKIPNELPGFSVERAGFDIKVEAQGAFVKQMSRDLAANLVQQIRAATGGILTSAEKNPLNPSISVVRRGSGIKLVTKEGEKTVAPSVANDLARLIAEAVDK